MGSLLSNLKKSRRGQALVEFALVFPIFIAMVFLLVDVGRYYFIQEVLTELVRSGLRAGVVYDPSNPPQEDGADLSRVDVINRAVLEANPFGSLIIVSFVGGTAVPDANVLATLSPPDGGGPDVLVTLEMEYVNFNFLTPFMELFFQVTSTGPIPLKVSQKFQNESAQ
jgi:hypothetical protein